MLTFALLTKLHADVQNRPKTILELGDDVDRLIMQRCPKVKWLANYAAFGSYDYLDIMEVPSLEDAVKAATIIRSLGASVEVWPLTPWNDYREIIRDLDIGGVKTLEWTKVPGDGNAD